MQPSLQEWRTSEDVSAKPPVLEDRFDSLLMRSERQVALGKTAYHLSGRVSKMKMAVVADD